MIIDPIPLIIQLERIYYILNSKDNQYKAEPIKVYLVKVTIELKRYKLLST